MKRAILTAITVMAAWTASLASASEPSLNLLLTGGPEQNVLDIKLSPDGRNYLIDSLGPLEAGGGVCVHDEGVENRLSCEAAAIAGFEVNAGAGDDSVTISPKVTVPVTLRGGTGNDRLRGGAGSDKLVGAAGDDTLLGSNGDDWLYGGRGNDWLFGGMGNDRLVGEAGGDVFHGGPGEDTEVLGPGDKVSPPARVRP